MFYPLNLDLADRSRIVQGLVVLTPAESKRLLAKAVASLPEVQWAYKNARLVVTNGSTNAKVLEEVVGDAVEPYRFCIGMVTDGLLSMSNKDDRVPARFYDKGEVVDMESRDFLKMLQKGDVVVKGGNAVDVQGNVGVLVGNETGGTIGALLGIACVRGIPMIMPVGLEKLVPSIHEAATGWGQLTLAYSMGMPCWLTPVSTGMVITEVEALGLMAGVKGRLVAAGGIGGSEGAVVLLLEGYKDNLDKAVALVEALKGEARVEVPRHHLSK
jgi:hypothetical protein